ncbi:MAG: DUF362 domain-containing protein [Bacteroidetes bacterium]|nr:DUF362 domain-containing protein [Bacteroidota bacterium]
MLARREFLKITGAATGTIILDPLHASSYPSGTTANYFTIHPFIEQNPDAVFIMRTDVNVKTNSTAVNQAGLMFGRSVFQLTDDAQTGIPLDHFFPIKPNLTSWTWDAPQNVDFEKVMGVVSDANFLEGVIESMKDLGINAEQISLLDANGSENYDRAGYGDMGNRSGVEIQLGAKNPQLQWVDVPEGVWFNRIPYLWPINTPNSWLLNIAKLKAHGMGLTLCAKNLQGSIASPYVAHCSSWGASMGIDPNHIQAHAFDVIAENYNRHKYAEIPRWGVAGSDFTGGLGMETWVTRCLDNNSVLKPGLNVIEGIYGRDGNGFYHGPHDGIAHDFMTNIIIFGKNAFYVDIIGNWLGGHEPGNFGLFHIAKERGFINTFNPEEIPLYEWNGNGEATLSELKSFERTELLTYYLSKPGEDQWHLCNEPYDYTASVLTGFSTSKPESSILQQNYPNPFNPSTSIRFVLPESGNTRLEIINSNGKIVDIIADGFYQKGTHLAVWRNHNLPSGTYFYRLRFNSWNEVKKMVLRK